ncbi:MAG: AMP-binding protein, partial [Acidobacteriaceae bacterium]
MREHLATLVDDFKRHGNQIAIVSYPGNRRIATSYAQLAKMAGCFSRLLAGRGIRPGERVLLWGVNSAEWVAAFFGCILRGVIVVPLDAAGGLEFAQRVIADVSPRLLVGDLSLIGNLPSFTPKLSLQDLAALPADPLFAPEPSLGRESPLQILYTSGTTSAPKGVVHTHGNVLASVDVLEKEMQRYLRYERWVHPLRFLHTLPLSHVFGQFMGLWVPPLLAAEVHYEDRLVTSHLIDRIRGERISVAAVVPRVLELLRAQLLADDPQLKPALLPMEKRRIWERWWSFRRVHRRFGFKFWAFVSGGAALPEEVEQFWNTLGFVLVQGYGMTETTALATLNHPFRVARGSIGKSLAGREIRIAEDGEILVRGPMLAAGVWRDGRMEPRLEEWLHTGDLGSMDNTGDTTGQIRFLGRKSDVIVTASGMNIHPADLEAAVRAQAGVRDCVVVGVDSARGPEPVAVVILDDSKLQAPEASAGKPGGWQRSEDFRTDGFEETAGILANANRGLQEFQQMRSVLPWPGSEFPRNAMGKLLRREVATWAHQQIGKSSSTTAGLSSRDPLLRLLEQVTGEPSEGLNDASKLSQLGLDSLGRMQLAIVMEEQFGIAVDDDQIANATTLGDLKELLNRERRQDGVMRTSAGRAADRGSSAASQISRKQDGMEAGEIPLGAKLTDNGYAARKQTRNSALKYPRWPWRAPMQAVRVVFLEGILRPLVALLANPRVQLIGPLPQEPSIYICNHVSSIDVALVLFALPPRVRRHMAVAMSAELLQAWRNGRAAAGVGAGPLRSLAPIQAYAVVALINVFPLPAGAGLRQSFAHAGAALDRGYNVLVFPEGRRTHDGELQAFQTGISLLAQESRTVVVPVALIGLRKTSRRPRVRPEVLVVATGMPLLREADESHAQFTRRLEGAVRHLIATG